MAISRGCDARRNRGAVDCIDSGRACNALPGPGASENVARADGHNGCESTPGLSDGQALSAFGQCWRKYLEYRAHPDSARPQRFRGYWAYGRLNYCITVEAIGRRRLTGRHLTIWRQYFLSGSNWRSVSYRLQLTQRSFFFASNRVRILLGRDFVAAGLMDAPTSIDIDRRTVQPATAKLFRMVA